MADDYKPVLENMPKYVQDAVGELVSTIDKGVAKQAVAGLDLSAFKNSVQYSGDNTQLAARPVGDMSQDQTRTV